MAEDQPQADVLGSNAQGQLKSVVDRLERLATEKAELAEQMKEVFAEAKGNGFCPRTIKKVLARRKMERAKLQEQEAMVELYESALGDLPLFEPMRAADTSMRAADTSMRAADTSMGVASIAVTTADGETDTVTPDSLAVGERIKRGADVEEALYNQAVALILRDGKASTSYVQRRLQLNFNHAAALMERMQREGVVGAPDHAGKREILQREAA